MRKSRAAALIRLQALFCFFRAASADGIGSIIAGVGNNGGSGCRLVMEKNEWAAGCM